MSGERGASNQKAEVIPDAGGDAAVHTAQPHRAGDHVFARIVAVYLCAQVFNATPQREFKTTSTFI